MRYLENELKAIRREENGLLRKERNRRIFTRGAMLEAFLIEPLKLDNGQVFEILKKAFNEQEVKRLLKKMIEVTEDEDK